MKTELDNMTDKYLEFLKAVDEFKSEAGDAILYKLLAFELIDYAIEDLSNNMVGVQIELGKYLRENQKQEL